MNNKQNNQFSPPRASVRHLVSGNLPATLISETGASLSYFIIDVSKQGLGVIVDSIVQPHSYLKLKLDINNISSKEINLKVIWAKPIQNIEGDMDFNTPLYRCGLKVTDKEIDLEHIFQNISSINLQTV